MVIHIGEVQKPLHKNSIERCSLYFLVQDLENLVELKGKDFMWMKEKYMLWIESPQSLEYKSKQTCVSHIIPNHVIKYLLGLANIYNKSILLYPWFEGEGVTLFSLMCLSVNPSLCLSYRKISVVFFSATFHYMCLTFNTLFI